MGHVVFGIPRIEHFHLHSRLLRKLVDREHRVTVLAADPVAREFYRAQDIHTVDVRPLRPRLSETLASQAPLSEFARVDCMLRGQSMPTGDQLSAMQKPATNRSFRDIRSLKFLIAHLSPDRSRLFAAKSTAIIRQ